MQWSDDKNSGFSQANSTWLPVNPNYIDLNVESQKAAEESHLKVYQALSKLRQDDPRCEFFSYHFITVPVTADKGYFQLYFWEIFSISYRL